MDTSNVDRVQDFRGRLVHTGRMTTSADRQVQPVADWITLEQAARRARVSTATLRREIARGRLRHARVGGRKAIRLRPGWVDAWLEAAAAPVEAPR